MRRLQLTAWTVLLFLAAVLTGCSDKDVASEVSEHKTYPTDSYHVSIVAGKGLQTGTRALGAGSDVNGEAGVIATWSSGDAVSVWKGDSKVGTLTAVPQSDAHYAVLEGTIVGNFKVGDKLTLHYEVPDDRVLNYNGQCGTLDNIGKHYDFASAIVTVNTIATATGDNDLNTLGTGDATFINQQAICRFTFKKDGQPLNVEKLTIFSACGGIQGADHDEYGRGYVTVKPSTATDVIYVAMRNGFESPDIYTFAIKTSSGDYYYKQTATDANGSPTGAVAIENGNFYPAEIDSWKEINNPSVPEEPDPEMPDPNNPDSYNPPTIPPVINDTSSIITNTYTYWPLITSDGHFVTVASEAPAHNWGHVVGLVVAFDGEGGLAMSLEDAHEGDVNIFKWSTIAALHEYKFSGSYCEGVSGSRYGPFSEAKEGWDPGTWYDCHGSQFHIENGIMQVPIVRYGEYYCQQQGDCMQYWADGNKNTTNLLSCSGSYSNNDNYISGHNHPAANAASSFSEVLPPNATTGWFLPSAYDWAKAMMGAGGAYLHFNPASYTFRQGYANSVLGNFNSNLSRASNEAMLVDQGYWLSNEHSSNNAGYIDNGSSCRWVNGSGSLVEGYYLEVGGDDKNKEKRVRPFFRFKFASHISLTNNYSLQLYGEHREDLDDI